MAFRRRRSVRRSGPRRKTQWEWASVFDGGDLLIGEPGNAGVTGGVDSIWIRPPAGTVDTSFTDTMRWPGDVTLLSFEGYSNGLIGPIPADGLTKAQATWWQGVIAWPGLDDVPPQVENTPDPSDGSWDWIWRGFSGGIFQTRTFDTPTFYERYHSKAKRKIDAGYGLLWCTCVVSLNDVIVGSPYTFQLVTNYRWLMALP